MREVNSTPERRGLPPRVRETGPRVERSRSAVPGRRVWGASSTTHRKGQTAQAPFRSEVANGVSGNLRRHPELLKTPHRKRREYRQRLARLSTIGAAFRPLETASRKRCAARRKGRRQAGRVPSAESTPAAKSGT